MSEGLSFTWDNKKFLVSAEVVTVIDDVLTANRRKPAKFTVKTAKAVEKRLVAMVDESQPDVLKQLRTELMTYCMFVGNQRFSEVTWLSQKIGDLPEVQPIVDAGVRWRRTHPVTA